MISVAKGVIGVILILDMYQEADSKFCCDYDFRNSDDTSIFYLRYLFIILLVSDITVNLLCTSVPTYTSNTYPAMN